MIEEKQHRWPRRVWIIGPHYVLSGWRCNRGQHDHRWWLAALWCIREQRK